MLLLSSSTVHCALLSEGIPEGRRDEGQDSGAQSSMEFFILKIPRANVEFPEYDEIPEYENTVCCRGAFGSSSLTRQVASGQGLSFIHGCIPSD